jgi:hypothetical protein
MNITMHITRYKSMKKIFPIFPINQTYIVPITLELEIYEKKTEIFI